MICVSLEERDPARLIELLAGIELAEIRLEALAELPDDLTSIFGRDTGTVATMRPGRHGDDLRARTLMRAIEAGARYVDVELEAPPELRSTVIGAARHRSCAVIVSHHDHGGTPPTARLVELVDACFDAGAGLAKIACLSRTPAEAARMLALLDDERPVIPIGMGEVGRPTRLAAPLLGAPFTYAAVAPGKETARGQYDARRLTALLAEARHG